MWFVTNYICYLGIVWSIDGNVVRTANRADTVSANDPSKTWFPNTPSQLQFSVWDTASSAPGTINWAGGKSGHFFPN